MSSVYFFPERGVESPAIKIGFSKDPLKRLKQLQTGHSSKIGSEGWLEHPNAQSYEQELHAKFSKYRIRGEWFEYSEEIKKFLNELRTNKKYTRFFD